MLTPQLSINDQESLEEIIWGERLSLSRLTDLIMTWHAVFPI